MRTRFVLLTTLCFMSIVAGAHGEKRVALVIGNSGYQNTAELKNSKNDAADMAAALARLGFEVLEGSDLDKRAMERMIRQFGLGLAGADLALFYYAGHGFQLGGQNYLVPVDARLASEGDVDFEGLPLSLVLKQMEREAKTNLVLLDACRDNPLAKNLARSMGTRSAQVGQGLAEVKAGVGTLIGFSTQPGNVALDGEGRNSPYAAALLKRIDAPGKDVSAILVAVRNDVLQATGGQQVPWEHTSLTGEVFLKASAAPTTQSPASAASTLDYDKEMEIALWNAVKDSKSPQILQTYLDRFPSGTFAGLAHLLIEQGKAAGEGKVASASRVASLPAEAHPVKPPDPPATDPAALARALQAELLRVGCHPGSLDGSWSFKSRQALKRFSRFSKSPLLGDEPTEGALQAVAGQKGRVCPPPCRPGEVEVSGRCLALQHPQMHSARERGGGVPRVCVQKAGVTFCSR